MRVELLPQQYDYVWDDHSRRVLIHGGRGSSKSTGMGWKVYRRAMHPGACEGLFRQKLIDLKTTTLRVLLEGVGKMPPIIPPGSYTHKQDLKIIRLHGGGDIVYNGMDQGDVGRQAGSTGKGSSMNLSGAHIDEAVEVSKANLIQIAGAVRVPVDGIPLQINMACNPGPPSHYLAEDFGLTLDHVAIDGYRSIHCNPLDNYFLPAAFIQDLRDLTGVARERYLYGKWVGSDGLVYDKWNRAVHVIDPEGEPKRVIIGVDDGYTDPFVCLRVEIDGDGRAHVAREAYEPGLTQPEKIDRVRAMSEDAESVVVDSAAPELVRAFRDNGIPAKPCTKGAGSIEFGINLVQSRLADAGDGRPRLTVSPDCTKTIAEFESYEWAQNRHGLKDVPIDANNHAMDALRYVVRSLEKPGGLYFPGMNDEKQPEPVAATADPDSVWDRMSGKGRDRWNQW